MIRTMLMGLMLAASTLATVAQAAGGGAVLFDFKPDVSNAASVQRGARDFMSYCSGCHSLKYLRYNRLARDNAIPEELLREHLMFTSDKPGDHILSAMPADAAAQWFGQAPPDLSLVTRSRGADWVYSFLLAFYRDDSKANGVNNLQLPGASMPHVLGGLQGYQTLAEHADEHHDGGHGPKPSPFEPAEGGRLSEKEYQRMVADLTTFLSYAAEPGKLQMHARGGWVLLYLLFLIPLTYLIKREFWKDVH